MIARSAATAIALCLMAGAAHATCGVGGYWGSECGPATHPVYVEGKGCRK